MQQFNSRKAKSNSLACEEKQRFREVVNTKGYSRERQSLIVYLQSFVDGVK